jgi:hypothetical protein
MHHHGRIIFPDLFGAILFFVSHMVAPLRALAEGIEDTVPAEIIRSLSTDEPLSENIVILLLMSLVLPSDRLLSYSAQRLQNHSNHLKRSLVEAAADTRGKTATGWRSKADGSPLKKSIGIISKS